MEKLPPIIAVAELLASYQAENFLIFDVSGGKDAKQNYAEKHIDGAQFVDLNTQLAEVKSDAAQGGRHPLPSIAMFAKTLKNLGITKESHVVLYDDKNGANAAARFWWMLKAIGHVKVQVLDGGFQHAEKAGFPINDTVEVPKAVGNYDFTTWKLPLSDIFEVEQNANGGDYLVIDVRENGRYNGEFEPIDLVAGHIPGAVNVPFASNLDENGLFLAPELLKEKYQELFAGKSADQVIVHCGSGVTACHSLLAINYAGLEIPKLYVGSWSEWSRNGKEIVRTN